MTHTRLLTGIFAATAVVMLAAGTPPDARTQQTQTDQVRTVISGGGGPPKLAVPEFIPLSNEPDVVAAAKAIGDVLLDDFAFEKEFYLLPRDILKTVPRPATAEQVAIDRWKELGADGVIVGTVRKSGDGILVEARLIKVADGTMALGKQYSGSAKSVADGGRVYAHSFADEVHKTQRNLRGVALTKLAFSSDRDGGRMKGPVGDRDISNIYQADYDGANPRRLTMTRSLDLAPVWEPNGASILYFSYRSGYPDLVLQSLKDARAPTFPAKGSPSNQNFLPAWSHDGTKIAFMSNRDGNPEIYVVNRDGSGLRRITNHPMAGRDADVVAVGQPARVHVGSQRRAAGLRRQPRRHRPRAHQRSVVLRSRDVVSPAAQRNRLRLAQRSRLRDPHLRLRYAHVALDHGRDRQQ